MKRLLVILLAFMLPAFAIAQEEQRATGYKPLSPAMRAAFRKDSTEKHGDRLAMLAQNQEIPPAFDCRDKGWVLPIGDQGNCGSCYLYSTIYGTLTQTFVRAGYGKADGSLVMAVQYGMDCHNFGGCNGGNGSEVIDWVVKNGWYAEKWVDTIGATHNDYPSYSARSQSCRKVTGAKLWKPASWGYVAASPNRPATTLEIKTALYNYGPLNVSLDAGGQFGSGTGTITRLGSSIDHEIELIAYDDNHDNGNGTKGAFLLKNQWGKGWGDNGVRWASYAACQSLVDVFFVTASLLPPPPPPPDPPTPPGPTPSGSTITLSRDLKAGTYELAPVGTKARLDAWDAWLKAMPERSPQSLPPITTEPPVVEKKDASTQPIGLPKKVEDKKSTKATITINVPEGALLWVDDTMLGGSSAKRTLETPDLPAGKKYVYIIKASWMWNEKAVTAYKEVYVTAGQETVVTISAKDVK